MNQLIALLLGSLAFAALASAASVAKPSCGGSTSSKNIQLLTPTNPPRECVYHIKAYSSNVCQLRIDFAMTLGQPSLPAADNDLTYAECVNDYFAVGDLKLCGVETKQHIYVPFNRTAGVTSVDLSIVLANRVGYTGLPTPSWDMTVTQLECPTGAALRSALQDPEALAALEATEPTDDSRGIFSSSITDGFWVAPNGCLQYFPQSSGVFTSFNYDLSNGIYPGNMNYAICFRRQTGTEALELRSLVFNLGSADNTSKELQVDNFCYSTLRTEGAGEDYVMVPEATIEKSDIRATYFCGDSIDGDTVRSVNPGPLMVIFNSDARYQQPEGGFYFTYKVV